MLRMQASLGGELTLDLALGERPVQLCLARRWEEDSGRVDRGAGGLSEASPRWHLLRMALRMLFALSRSAVAAWWGTKGSAGTGSCAASSSGWRWRTARSLISTFVAK